MVPPPVNGLGIEEIHQSFGLGIGVEYAGLLAFGEHRARFAVVENGADVQTEHVYMLGIDGIDHCLGIGELGLELKAAAAIAETGIEDAPSGVEPQQVEGNALLAHALHQVYIVLSVGLFLVFPRAAAVGSEMQAIGRARHHGTHAGECLILMEHVFNLRSQYEIIVERSFCGGETVVPVIAPAHVPVGGSRVVEENGIAFAAHEVRHRAVVGAQDVFSAHSGLCAMTEFHVQMDYLAALVDVVHAFAEAKEMLVGREAADGFRPFLLADANLRFLIEHVSFLVFHGDAPGVGHCRNLQVVGCHIGLRAGGEHVEVNRLEIVFHHHPRFVLGKSLAGAFQNAHHLAVAEIHAHVTLPGHECERVAADLGVDLCVHAQRQQEE